MRTFISELDKHRDMVDALAECYGPIEEAGQLLLNTLRHGGKILLCGNGGSAADCQHIAAEFVVRYERKRRGLAAIALTTDSSILTAHSNDFEFSTVFSRQIEAIGRPQDCLIAISTSGNSKNVVKAAEVAKQQGLSVIALTGGNNDGELLQYADIPVQVPSAVTARVQEGHILIGHWWCALVEDNLIGEAQC